AWSSDVCSSDLPQQGVGLETHRSREVNVLVGFTAPSRRYRERRQRLRQRRQRLAAYLGGNGGVGANGQMRTMLLDGANRQYDHGVGLVRQRLDLRRGQVRQKTVGWHAAVQLTHAAAPFSSQLRILPGFSSPAGSSRCFIASCPGSTLSLPPSSRI